MSRRISFRTSERPMLLSSTTRKSPAIVLAKTHRRYESDPEQTFADFSLVAVEREISGVSGIENQIRPE